MTLSRARSSTARDHESLVESDYAYTDRDFREIASMLYADARIHLAESKSTLVYSRLVKRLRALNLESFSDYCDLLRTEEGGGERLEMLSALTTNVTKFFREVHHFEQLKTQVLPQLLARARQGDRVRIWSAGCSTGEEPYSIALTILGSEPNAAGLDIKILATDIDPRVVAFGRTGVYPDAAMTDVPAEPKKRFFDVVTEQGVKQYRANEALRALVAFRLLNLNSQWPMRGPFEVIFCRNVVIYFDEKTQNLLWREFAKKLAPGGRLYVGHSERVNGPASACFDGAGVTSYLRNQVTA